MLCRLTRPWMHSWDPAIISEPWLFQPRPIS